MKFLIFTADLPADCEACASLPGFSSWNEPFKDPQLNLLRTIHFFARTRTEAARQLRDICGIDRPCNLSAGQSCKALEGEWLRRSYDRYLAGRPARQVSK